MHKITLLCGALLLATGLIAQDNTQNLREKAPQNLHSQGVDNKAQLKKAEPAPPTNGFQQAQKVDAAPTSTDVNLGDRILVRQKEREKYARFLVDETLPADFPKFNAEESHENFKAKVKVWMKSNKDKIKPEALENERFANKLK